MIYDGPRDSFVQNAKLALKLADTEAQFWTDLTHNPHPVIAGSAGKVRKASVSVASSVGDVARAPTPRKPYLTFVEAPASPPKPERKSHVAAAGTAARLFLRRSLHGFKKHECVACQNVVVDVSSVRVPCGHFYDVPCLLSLVKASTRDETLFPPRCCKETLPVTLFEKHMDAQLAALFALKTQEFGTPKRVYCAKITCSRFLGPRSKSKGGPLHTYDCPEPGCTTRTCSRCRFEVKKHVLHACRPDDVPRRLVQRGCAQQCPGCDRLIELQSGCFHITCTCKTQFCYRCGLKWKTCKCPLWENSCLGVDGVETSQLPPPILPPVPRSDRFRQTWIHPQPQERPTEPISKRRGRSSAPATLQGYIRARESVVLRGVQAQERRAKPKTEQPLPPSSPSSLSLAFRSTIDSHRLDILEERINRLLQEVEHYPCRHDWRADMRSTTRGSCACGSSAVVYCCSLCATLACMKCRCAHGN